MSKALELAKKYNIGDKILKKIVPSDEPLNLHLISDEIEKETGQLPYLNCAFDDNYSTVTPKTIHLKEIRLFFDDNFNFIEPYLMEKLITSKDKKTTIDGRKYYSNSHTDSAMYDKCGKEGIVRVPVSTIKNETEPTTSNKTEPTTSNASH